MIFVRPLPPRLPEFFNRANIFDSGPLRTDFCPKKYFKEGLHSPAATIEDLYKGISGPLLGAAFINGIVFATEEMVCNALGSHSVVSHTMAGAVAGAAQSINGSRNSSGGLSHPYF